MTRTRLAIVAAAAALAAAGCGTTSTTSPTTLALDSPVDVAFACYGELRLTGGGRKGLPSDPPFVEAAAPLADCDQWAIWDKSNDPAQNNADGTPNTTYHNPAFQPLGQEDLTATDTSGSGRPVVEYYALILQSVPGTVAIAHWPTKMPTGKDAILSGDVQLKDIDPLTPGANSISIGDLPVGVAADRNGCYAITANAGSCDLSTLDIGSALSGNRAIVDRATVTDASGAPVLARPAAVAMEPAGGTIGGYDINGQLQACPAAPAGIMYVAYPGCHVVAAIDVGTGKVKGSIHFDTATPTLDTTGNLTCSDECGGGAAGTAGVRPSSLSLVYDARVDTRRLAIGAPNSNVVTVVDLDAGYLPTGTPTTVALDQTSGAIGVDRLALSPQIGMGGDQGHYLDDGSDGGATGGQFQFVYAVASDGSVRVADVLDEKNECETQADPRFLTGVTDVHYLSCMPVGDARNPPRRAGAVGPGIRLSANDRPIAVTFVHPVPDTTVGVTPAPLVWMGYFAIVTAISGRVYVVNVDDDNYADTDDPTKPLSSWVALALPHQLRDRINQRSNLAEKTETMMNPDGSTTSVTHQLCDVSGSDSDNPDADASVNPDVFYDGPHVFAQAGSAVQQASSLAAVAVDKLGELPTIHQVLCHGDPQDAPASVLAFTAPHDVRKNAFPDLVAMPRDEVWRLTWEGALSNDSLFEHLDGSIVRFGEMNVDASGVHVTEGTHPYCGIGVEKYDEVILRGCDVNAGNACGVGNTCYVDPAASGSAGTCLPTAQADALGPACHEFLISPRRYAALDVSSGSLKLVGRRHVLRTTPVDGCMSSDQCAGLERVADSLPYGDGPTGAATPGLGSCAKKEDCAGNQTCDTTTGTCVHSWSCEADPTRFDPSDASAPKQCVMTCTSDADCDGGANGVCDGGRCVDGVIPPAQCVATLESYEIHGSEAFVAIGDSSGYQHPIIEDKATGACVRDPKASPLLVGRIPLNPPPCVGMPTIDNLSPNPCSTTVSQVELDTVYTFDPNSKTCTASATPQLVTRDTPAIRFRNPQMTFELVDPIYPGDANCVGDRMGALPGGVAGVPTVFPGYALQMRIVSGFMPFLLGGGGVSYPINVVRGPEDSIWVMDNGDNVSGSVVSSKGAVFRFESVAPEVENNPQ